MCWRPVTSTVRLIKSAEECIELNKFDEATRLLAVARRSAGPNISKQYEGRSLSQMLLFAERRLGAALRATPTAELQW